MKIITILTVIIGSTFLCCLAVDSKAAETTLCSTLRTQILFVNTDTIPTEAKPVEQANKAVPPPKAATDLKPSLPEKPGAGKPIKAVIKQVPKARKVEVPLKVKVVKPKIIKPAVKIL